MKKNLFKSLIAVLYFSAIHLTVRAQCTAATIPYYEDFGTITANNQLPACWAASSLGSGCLTYPGYAAFLDVSSGPHYFYSRALALNAGITYSVSVWKKGSIQNSTNAFFAIFLNTAQTSGGQPITALAPVTNTYSTPTSNTFTVANSGTYYLAIGGAFMGSGLGEYIYFDDLRVIAPCPYPGNSPTVTISSSSPTICAGQIPPTLTATGADTYTWSDGTQGPTFTVSPQVTTNFQVTGTNTLSGCAANATYTMHVKPSPVVIVLAASQSICLGQSVVLTAGGAQSYSWSSGGTGSSITVTPTINTQYTVTGTNQYSCSTVAAVMVGVHQLPVITINPTSHTMCLGDSVTISAGGAQSFKWSDASSTTGASLSVSPQANIVFTVTGMNQNGCVSSNTSSILVSECTSVTEFQTEINFRIYPNPCQTQLNVEIVAGAHAIIIYNLMGREIIKSDVSSIHSIDVSSLSSGIYLVNIDGINKRFIKE